MQKTKTHVGLWCQKKEEEEEMDEENSYWNMVVIGTQGTDISISYTPY